ncbi:MAG: pilus assembly protein PilM [Desulfobacterales bacterium]|nr:pilus assembly protein PilM [Deltaproteobacteria bacterium]NNL77879.1 pilus assembly protein PilM [Desulfobacterales bacterium]
MSRKILGIDIRKESISAVLLKTSLRESRVEAHAYVPISDPEEGPGNIRTALENLCNEIDPVGCDCVVSISADHFSYRNLQIPFKDSKKIRMVLPFELEPTIPFSVEDLVVDFIDLENAHQGDHTDIMALAVPKSELTPYIQDLAAVKIDPEMLTVSGLPAALCLGNRADLDENQLLLVIDQTQSTLFIIESGRIKLIRSFPTPVIDGGRARPLVGFVQRTLSAFEEFSQSDFQPLDMVVSGTGLNGTDLAEDIASALDLSVKQSNFADHFNIPVDSKDIKPWDPALMDSALSLVMAESEGIPGPNFHKSQFAAKKFLIKHKNILRKTGILAAAVMMLLVINAITSSYTLNRRIIRFDQQLTSIFQSTFPDVKRIEDPLRQMQIKVQEARKTAVIQNTTTPHIRSIDILNKISSNIPASIVVDITRMVISPDSVIISGNTDTYDSVDDIKSKLEQIDFFKKVKIDSSKADRSGKEIRFQLKVEL